MSRASKPSTVRRSVALPRQLIQEAVEAAPAELRGNLNRLVVTSLREYAERRRARAFEEAMTRMAEDPDVRSGPASPSTRHRSRNPSGASSRRR